jgi:hypothetical protein
MVLILSPVLPGCFREAARDLDCLTGSRAEKIHVETKDGSRYWFSGGEYSVGVDSTGAKVLIGTGRRDRGDNKSSEKFEGIVPFSAIERVSAAETSPWLTFSLGVLTGFALFMVFVLVSFSGFKVG